MVIYAKSGSTIHIGRVGENLATTIVFDISNWAKDYETEGKLGEATLIVEKDGITYPQLIKREGNSIFWTITESNTIYAGMGKCELLYSITKADGLLIVKSAIYDFIVTNALAADEGAEPPDPYENWFTEVVTLAHEVKEKIDDAIQSAKDAKDSEIKADASAKAADASAQAADASVQAAAMSAMNAKTSEDNAKGHEANADASAKAANTSEINANASAQAADASAKAANTSAQDAATSAANAALSETNALYSEVMAKYSQEEAEAWAVGTKDGVDVLSAEPQYNNNAKYYSDLAKLSADTAVQYGGKPAQSINGTWWIWDFNTQSYIDTGINSIFYIKKTYPSIADMEADFANMSRGDLVLIRIPDVNAEDNAKFYQHTGDYSSPAVSWNYLADLSGKDGNGIKSVEVINAPHLSGQKDEYRVNFTDGTSFNYEVYNGVDGHGDMDSSAYDSDHTVATEGGIAQYVDKTKTAIHVKIWTEADLNSVPN